MAMAIQPLMTLGSTALPKLPAAVKYIQDKTPGVYDKFQKMVSMSGVTPEVVAARAMNSPLIAQSLVTTALRAGAKASDFIEAGVFHKDMQAEIEKLAAGYVRALADKAEKDTVPTPSDPVNMAAEIRLLTQVCSILSVDAKALAVLLTYFRTHGPADVESVIEFKKLAGVRAY